MKYTDDKPEVLTGIPVVGNRAGPIGISNHSKFGFNIRHYYYKWQSETFEPTQKGIMIDTQGFVPLMQALAEFARENDIADVTVTVNGDAV